MFILQVSTLLLTGLLFYDIFWVFFSSYLFKTNVMVRVATRQVDSPLAMLVASFSSDTSSVPTNHNVFKVRSSLSIHSGSHGHEYFLGRQKIPTSTFNSGFNGGSTKLSLPGKLVFPSWDNDRYTMLGLGDVVVPGLVCSVICL